MMDFGHGVWWEWVGVAGMLVMAVFWIALIALIVWAIVWGVRTVSRRDEGARESSALEIARQRYARGEINKEEFEEIRRTLRS